MTGELQDYKLARTGRPPLAFRGEFLAGAYKEDYLGDQAQVVRWHELELYQTRARRYVLWVRYHSTWKDEVGYDDVLVLENPRDVTTAALSWDPAACVRGYPPGDFFVEKQAVLLDEIRERFDRCVSELLSQLGPEFAERID